MRFLQEQIHKMIDDCIWYVTKKLESTRKTNTKIIFRWNIQIYTIHNMLQMQWSGNDWNHIIFRWCAILLLFLRTFKYKIKSLNNKTHGKAFIENPKTVVIYDTIRYLKLRRRRKTKIMLNWIECPCVQWFLFQGKNIADIIKRVLGEAGTRLEKKWS